MAPANSRINQWQNLWAKTDRDWSDRNSPICRYHPLLYHMLDVAAVAGLVLDDCLDQHLRRKLGKSLGNDIRSVIVFLAGAHDLGKASPGFQRKVPELSRHTGLPYSSHDQIHPHGFISARILKEAFGSCTSSNVLAQIAGGHHGLFPRSSDLRMARDTLGNNQWKIVRLGVLRKFAEIVGFDLDRSFSTGSEILDPAIIPILAGFISVVDWIGSNQDFFPCAAECGAQSELDSEGYWRTAQTQAREALEQLGWMPAVSFARETRFDAVFRGYTPNSLQKTAIELASQQTSPYLMIVEAPMGQGKTEAALYAADLSMCRGFSRGMYIAMPTQATGNAMFRRVLDGYLRKRGHQGKLNLQLVHGDASVALEQVIPEGEIPEFKPGSVDHSGDVEAQSWFTAGKRPLLASFGVGTIDQGLLSVLQTRHWFVRLFGLAGKVLIFDEVHAYDAYMSTILERLLHWLAELDSTVILLSATLPEVKRKALVQAYSGREDVQDERYPRITLGTPRRYPVTQADQAPASVVIPTEAQHQIGLGFSTTDLPSLTAILGKQLRHGGCAAVICNTVNRSIEVHEHLRDNLEETECLLFHARTLRKLRREREAEVLRKFGKHDSQETDQKGRFTNPNRPHRAVLVATQVIEQSLDLDFDLMVSEIAPIDLLLQRSGRLHRHPLRRPTGLEEARFIVLCDAGTVGPPPESFGRNIEHVYDRYILLRTWLTIRERDAIYPPSDIEKLVEEVYGESTQTTDGSWDSVLNEAQERMESNRRESEMAGSRLLVCQPKTPGDLIEEFNHQLVDDDDPQANRAIRAATREGDPSIMVVMLPSSAVLNGDPNVSEVRALLDRSAKLNHRGIFQTLLGEGESPHVWSRNAHLRHARLLRLDERNQCRVGDYVLTADEELGIVIEKDGG